MDANNPTKYKSKEKTLMEWNKLFKEGSENNERLKNEFDSFLKFQVPQIFQTVPACTINDDTANHEIFLFFEIFICNRIDSKVVLKEVKELDGHSQICGKLLQNREPTYSCKECAFDDTCVFCSDCFNNSIHKGHAYRIGISGGGGYCDCGDVEAWKSDSHCNLHIPKNMDIDEDSKISPIYNLPPEIRNRASFVFNFLSDYMIKIITWSDCERLPDSYELNDNCSDLFVTMIFNDEIHTYDQVIHTFTKSLGGHGCDYNKAVEYATSIDKDGRTIVLCSTKAKCESVTQSIQKYSRDNTGKALIAKTMRTTVVAHQTFAYKIINWLLSIISKSEMLMYLFCYESMIPRSYCIDKISILEEIMLKDTLFWKSARISCHQLYMSGILKNQDLKVKFGKLFIKHYPQVLYQNGLDDSEHIISIINESVYDKLYLDFNKDDHHRNVSVVGFSVQLLTTYCLSKTLIREDNALYVLINTFIVETSHKLVKNKFCFKQGRPIIPLDASSMRYKRSLFILTDIKYMLSITPDFNEFDENFSSNFLMGFNKLLQLLSCLQSADSFKKYTAQHVEYEPEWEECYTLQIRLGDILPRFIEWCFVNKNVLREAVKLTINKIFVIWNSEELTPFQACIKVPFISGVKPVAVLKFDISSGCVSLHAPLQRLLSGLFSGLAYHSITLLEIIDECKPIKLEQYKMQQLIEPILRVQALIAHNRAGLWRRNGLSLNNQIYYYHNLPCRQDMFDKDILMLQYAASVLPANDFLINVLNRYGLLNWIAIEYDNPDLAAKDEIVRQTIIIAEEFLILILYILNERYVMNIGKIEKEDIFEHEIIHLLCINPMSHSSLCKHLDDNIFTSTILEKALSKISEKKILHSGKIEYCLKKEYYNLYNPLFYHYNKTDQTKAEQSQLKRRKEENEDECLPMPKPPMFHQSVCNISLLLKSDVLLYIKRLILERISAKRSRSASESQLQLVLHLINLGLYEEENYFENGDRFGYFDIVSRGAPSIFNLLQSLMENSNVKLGTHKNLLTWTLKRFIFIRNLLHTSDSLSGSEYLARLSSQNEHAKTVQKAKVELASRRKKKILEQMEKRQKAFIKSCKYLFDEVKSFDVYDSNDKMDGNLLEHSNFPISVGEKRTRIPPPQIPFNKTCILCQENQSITLVTKRPMVLCTFIQKSTVLSQNRTKVVQNIKEYYESIFFPADLILGSHVSTCGHIMHSDCWQNWYEALTHRDRRRLGRFQNNHFSYDIETGEYLCPLCETLGNSILPVLPSLTYFTEENKKDVSLSINDWLCGLRQTVRSSIQTEKILQTEKLDDEFSILYVPCPLSSITKLMAESVEKNFKALFEYYYDADPALALSESIINVVKKFALDCFTRGSNSEPNEEDRSVPILSWVSTSYTIMSTEHLIRYNKNPLFAPLPARQEDCLQNLVKYSAVSTVIMEKNLIKEYCIRMLSAIICYSSDERLKKTPSILEIDLFHLLVPLVLSLPTLYAENNCDSSTTGIVGASINLNDSETFQSSRIATGDLNSKHILRLILTAHVVQVILTTEENDIINIESNVFNSANDISSNTIKLSGIFNMLRKLAHLKPITAKPMQIKNYIEKAISPFVRCAGLFFHYLTSVPPPDCLKESNDNEFQLLCKYMSLPDNLSDLFDQGDVMQQLCHDWCNDEASKQCLQLTKDHGHILTKHPIKVNTLCKLPKEYKDFLHKALSFVCPKRKDFDESRSPTMCLICGEMLCSQSFCCQDFHNEKQIGAATRHVKSCGAGTGLLIRIRECQLLMLTNKMKGSFHSTPYVDTYGETDMGLRRGNPLYLSTDAVDKLNKLWLKHAIPETIAHNLEANINWLAFDWQNL